MGVGGWCPCQERQGKKGSCRDLTGIPRVLVVIQGRERKDFRPAARRKVAEHSAQAQETLEEQADDWGPGDEGGGLEGQVRPGECHGAQESECQGAQRRGGAAPFYYCRDQSGLRSICGV